jgi:DNA replication and repair protein RecF
MKSFRLNTLSLVNYRSYSELQMKFQKPIALLVGKNGVGKTNVLDAIYLLSFSKGFLASSDQQNIRKESDEFLVKGQFAEDAKTSDVYCGFKRGKKKVFKRNSKEYEKIFDHIGLYPAVLVSPQDNELISGSADLRRKFMDGHLSQTSAAYLNQLSTYNKGIIQRNAALKSRSGNIRSILEAMDIRLVPCAQTLRKLRMAFLEELQAPFSEYYSKISGDKEAVGIRYAFSGEEIAESWVENVEKDMQLGYTSSGPHRDELKFTMDGSAIRRFGSQGQQKCYLLALKLAQANLLEKHAGKAPILLLDDVFDKLDKERMERLIKEVVSVYKGQVFITNTEAETVTSAMQQDQYEIWDLNENVLQ